ENTMFGIASNTKAFTSAALAILVDRGQIAWDDKVIDYLPYFELYDPYVTKNMTVRDLLSHHSGLETFSGDLLWHSTSYSREEIIQRARFLRPKYGFRSHFGYSNLMFLTAGEIIPAVTDTSYDDFLQKYFFDPLNMESTNTSIRKFSGIDNLAIPHIKHNGEIIPIKYISWDNIAPAGGINSSVSEMTGWLMLQLNRGTYNGRRYFSEEASEDMWTPQTPQRIRPSEKMLFPSMHLHAYALGWDVFDYQCRLVVNHSGGLDGMTSHVALLPEENLGFVILTNSQNYLSYALMFKIIDVLIGIDGDDYSARILKLVKMNEAFEEQERKQAEENRARDTKPSLPLEKYAGIYHSDLYGDAELSLVDGKLVLKFLPAPEFISGLDHLQYDIFRVEFKNFPSLPPGTVEFMITASTNIGQMRIDVPNPDFDFTELRFFKVNE
ncbi:MAG: serine hydrolase, partial [Bacteroidetes bacterium]|nr:serine hydrolase [Bacteroidota bacterium]